MAAHGARAARAVAAAGPAPASADRRPGAIGWAAAKRAATLSSNAAASRPPLGQPARNYVLGPGDRRPVSAGCAAPMAGVRGCLDSDRREAATGGAPRTGAARRADAAGRMRRARSRPLRRQLDYALARSGGGTAE